MDYNSFETPQGNDELEEYYKQLNDKNNNNNMDSKMNIEQSDKNKIEQSGKNIIEQQTLTFDIYKKAPMVSLENCGNTSYMNCVIQGLANIRSIVSYYLRNLNEFKKNLEVMPLSYSFSRVIFHLYPYPQDPLPKSYSLSSFHKVVTYLNPMFKGNSNKSPVDFIVYLLDALHNDDKKMPDYKNNLNGKNMEKNNNFKEFIKILSEEEKSIIFTNFCWINQKIKKCNACNSESILYQKFFTFDLDIEGFLDDLQINKKMINNEIHILECIKYQCQSRKLHNCHCQNCGRKNGFSNESNIRISPPIFVLLIKLNDNFIQELIKNNYKIMIDYDISLSDIIKDQQNYLNYTLHGFVVVDPDERNEKSKYKAYFCSPADKNWYLYNDNIIKNIQNQYKNIHNYRMYPVILFYRHC